MNYTISLVDALTGFSQVSGHRINRQLAAALHGLLSATLASFTHVPEFPSLGHQGPGQALQNYIIVVNAVYATHYQGQ